MNKEELKGKMHNLKGRAKEAVGSLTGNKKMQAEGTAERILGAGVEKVGQVEEKLASDVRESDLERGDDEEPTSRPTSPSTEDPYPVTKH